MTDDVLQHFLAEDQLRREIYLLRKKRLILEAQAADMSRHQSLVESTVCAASNVVADRMDDAKKCQVSEEVTRLFCDVKMKEQLLADLQARLRGQIAARRAPFVASTQRVSNANFLLDEKGKDDLVVCETLDELQNGLAEALAKRHYLQQEYEAMVRLEERRKRERLDEIESLKREVEDCRRRVDLQLQTRESLYSEPISK